MILVAFVELILLSAFLEVTDLHENIFFAIFVQHQILTLISEIVTSFF